VLAADLVLKGLQPTDLALGAGFTMGFKKQEHIRKLHAQSYTKDPPKVPPNNFSGHMLEKQLTLVNAFCAHGILTQGFEPRHVDN
jgi:hypothetical protein